ncbi:GNAT family N-acetyltransferase [Aureimonas phyllosphaerae]|uniref:Ribosomal-protein-alanine N-acetyltransferase n=1 Tax=Aureimonas phyllosphaerae TaxID=1166078 RepID=A0A7W6FWX6_9HYPH|nr:GNAT family N-acetyltransferase [Aureimonas phyllosphaerae]MBB3937472.1 ribosomal-protein-alanine N-acetyltransferase [Aureimonas phyllosphaerae]MBB3961462.1 ribosomal-protein-alanine N-acetyltransferase [Aureimonas phyllosphaerae]
MAGDSGPAAILPEEEGMYWYLPWAWTLSFWDSIVTPVDHVAEPMAADDVEWAAALHSQAFSQPWSGDEFAALLSQKGTFGFVVRRTGQVRPLGVVLFRTAADEAEILTIVVDRAARGKGFGRLLMDNVLQHLHSERAASLFLEVEETNTPALKLYRHLRFEEVGRRPAYYVGADGQRQNALILKRTLGPY